LDASNSGGTEALTLEHGSSERLQTHASIVSNSLSEIFKEDKLV